MAKNLCENKTYSKFIASIADCSVISKIIFLNNIQIIIISPTLYKFFFANSPKIPRKITEKSDLTLIKIIHYLLNAPYNFINSLTQNFQQ